METALVYDSDSTSGNSEPITIKHEMETLRGANRGRRRNSMVQSQPLRRSLRSKINEEPISYNENDIMARVMSAKVDKTSGTEEKKAATKSDEENVDKILGATGITGQLQFFFKWKNQDEPTLVSSDEAKIKYPFSVIDFYESCMVWDTSDNEAEDIDNDCPDKAY